MLNLHSFVHIGKTYKHVKVRVPEHRGASPSTGKPVKGTPPTSVRDHMLICDHQVAWEDSGILGSESNTFLITIEES